MEEKGPRGLLSVLSIPNSSFLFNPPAFIIYLLFLSAAPHFLPVVLLGGDGGVERDVTPVP